MKGVQGVRACKVSVQGLRACVLKVCVRARRVQVLCACMQGARACKACVPGVRACKACVKGFQEHEVTKSMDGSKAGLLDLGRLVIRITKPPRNPMHKTEIHHPASVW